MCDRKNELEEPDVDTGFTGELSTKLLIEEAKRRGCKVELLDASDNFIRISDHQHVEYIKQATKTSADRYSTIMIMENKLVTKKVLTENSLRVPDGYSVTEAAAAAEYFPVFAGKSAVVKPNSTNFGKGVVIIKEVKSPEMLSEAASYALTFDASVLIEEFLTGKEYRFLVIGDQAVAILHRVPANVKGDGIHTIAELAVEKNKDPLRGEGYVSPLEKIRLGVVEADFLAGQGMNFATVPMADEIVFLRENSNISTGGDSIDCTDSMHASYKELAVRAAKAVGANICGVDMMVIDMHEPADDRNYGIIELNFNPALHIHDFPYQGENRHVERNVLDLLGFRDRSGSSG